MRSAKWLVLLVPLLAVSCQYLWTFENQSFYEVSVSPSRAGGQTWEAFVLQPGASHEIWYHERTMLATQNYPADRVRTVVEDGSHVVYVNIEQPPAAQGDDDCPLKLCDHSSSTPSNPPPSAPAPAQK